jgi:hypothetical protein
MERPFGSVLGWSKACLASKATQDTLDTPMEEISSAD